MLGNLWQEASNSWFRRNLLANGFDDRRNHWSTLGTPVLNKGAGEGGGDTANMIESATMGS